MNLHALLGAQCGDVATIRAIWSIQDRIALDAAEEKATELKREIVAGQERVVCNPSLSLPANEYQLSDPEVARIKTALQTWDSYGVAADRRWLLPLLELLFGVEAQHQHRSTRLGNARTHATSTG